MSEAMILIPLTAICIIAVLYSVKRFFFQASAPVRSEMNIDAMEKLETMALVVAEMQGKLDKLYLSRITSNADKG